MLEVFFTALTPILTLFTCIAVGFTLQKTNIVDRSADCSNIRYLTDPERCLCPEYRQRCFISGVLCPHHATRLKYSCVPGSLRSQPGNRCQYDHDQPYNVRTYHSLDVHPVEPNLRPCCILKNKPWRICFAADAPRFFYFSFVKSSVIPATMISSPPGLREELLAS